MISQVHEAFLIRFATLLHMRSLVQNSFRTENVRIATQQFSENVSKENKKTKILFYI